jgi:hypothetical protein
VKDAAKNGGVGGGREDFALRGSAGGSTGPARLEHVDDVAFPDPAFYIKCPDREAENVSR